VWRRALSSALLAVGGIFLLLSAGTIAYAQWAEWHHALEQPAGPQETLPERLDLDASGASGLSEAIEPGVASAPSPPLIEPVAAGPPAVADAEDRRTPPALAATPVPTLTADGTWQETLGRLEATWESNWPEAIALLDSFHAQFPDHAAATEKLYGALVSYGRALVESGQVAEGIAQLKRAQDLEAGPGEASASLLALTPTPMPEPSSVPPTAARPAYGPPVWITIPRIGVKSSIMAVGAQGSAYQVPSFDVGHHADSANPGEPGNSVFNGHLETIDAGRVFARLRELRVGDAVYVYTSTHRLDWVVQQVRTVPNTDHSFILPTADTRITLYTCAGRYNPLARDYTHRLAVVGGLVRAGPRT
jgi:LPXTG-site transpeptidase (sortase) family protein